LGDPDIKFGVFGSDTTPKAERFVIRPDAKASRVFREYRVEFPLVSLQAEISKIRPTSARTPWQYGPALSWRTTRVPISPDDSDFEKAAEWTITVPRVPDRPQVADLFLRIHYNGDAARLYQGGKLVDDSFWNGLPWEIGLREIGTNWREQADSFTVQVLPLPKNYPMYIEDSAKLRFGKTDTVAMPPEVHLVPEYQVVLHSPESP
jgi:hypothetical protein